MGHDPGKEFTDHWWMRVFNDAAKKGGTKTEVILLLLFFWEITGRLLLAYLIARSRVVNSCCVIHKNSKTFLLNIGQGCI